LHNFREQIERQRPEALVAREPVHRLPVGPAARRQDTGSAGLVQRDQFGVRPAHREVAFITAGRTSRTGAQFADGKYPRGLRRSIRSARSDRRVRERAVEIVFLKLNHSIAVKPHGAARQAAERGFVRVPVGLVVIMAVSADDYRGSMAEQRSRFGVGLLEIS